MKRDRVSGFIVLLAGLILLAFTFLNAYIFLIGPMAIVTSGNLTEAFGAALAPLIEALIHTLYLGIMGWIGSIITVRAVQLLKLEKDEVTTPLQLKEAKPPKPSTMTESQHKQEGKATKKKDSQENS